MTTGSNLPDSTNRAWSMGPRLVALGEWYHLVSLRLTDTLGLLFTFRAWVPHETRNTYGWPVDGQSSEMYSREENGKPDS